MRKFSFFVPLLLVAYEAITYLSNDMYLPALPSMMDELGLDSFYSQLTLTSWFLGAAFMPLIVGGLIDRFGRKPILLLSGVVYVLANLICALTQNIPLFLSMRFVQGAMMSTLLVTSYSTIHDNYPHKEAVRILAIMGSISILAPAFGPLLGGVILSFASWRGIFWFIALSAIIPLTLLSQSMPTTTITERQRLHLFSLIKKYGRVIINADFMLLMGVEGLIFGGFLSWVTSSPLLIMQNFNATPITYGITQSLVFGACMLGNYGVKKLLASHSVSFLARMGICIASIGGLSTLGTACCFPSNLPLFVLSMMLFSLGAGFCFPSLNRLIIETSNESMNIRVALFTVFQTGFGAMGSALSSLFFDGSLLSLSGIIVLPLMVAYGFGLLFMWRRKVFVAQQF